LTQIIEKCSDPNLIEAVEKIWYKQFWYWSIPKGERYEDEYLKRIVLFAPEWPSFNSVHLAQMEPNILDKKIEEMIQYFRNLKLPWTWYTGPSTKPNNLGEHLLSHGMTHNSDMPGMAMELDQLKETPPEPENFTIEKVEDEDTLKDWIEAASDGYNLPESTRNLLHEIESSLGFRKYSNKSNYVGYMNEKPVATALMILDYGVAGIFAVSTIPEARRKGIGTLITAKPLLKAREMGYKVGVLHSSPMGLKVYSRLGFKEYCKIGIYR